MIKFLAGSYTIHSLFIKLQNSFLSLRLFGQINSESFIRGAPLWLWNVRVIVQFKEFRLNLPSGDLFRNGRLISLKPQPTKLLIWLVSHPGVLITRDQIRKQIWTNEVFVDYENGINSCIRQLRRILDDDAHRSRYIQTIPRRGYRFIAPVRALNQGRRPDTTSAARLALITQPYADIAGDVAVTLQVTRLRNISNSQETLYLAEGLSEELLVQLVEICGNKIAIIDHLYDVGNANGTYILKGCVQKEGSRFRVAVRLVQVCDHHVVGTGTVEREIVSVLDFQLEVAKLLAQLITQKIIILCCTNLSG